MSAFMAACLVFLVFSPVAALVGLAIYVAETWKPIDEIVENAFDDAWKKHKPTIKAHILAAIEPEIRKAVKELWDSNLRFRFVKWMQFEMQRIDKTLGNEEAFNTAVTALNSHLEGENIEFGDASFSWDEGGAIDVIHAYEIDHWEPKP